MKYRTLVLSVVLSLTVFILSCERKDETSVVILEDFEQEIVDLINYYRDTTGKNELIIDTILRREARNHSINIATGRVPFGHEGFKERSNTIFSELGGTVCGENVAEGNYPDAYYLISKYISGKFTR
jgi:uncharacterized protein YkwD